MRNSKGITACKDSDARIIMFYILGAVTFLQLLLLFRPSSWQGTREEPYRPGLMKSVPPLNDLFDQAGMALPEYLAKKKDEAKEAE